MLAGALFGDAWSLPVLLTCNASLRMSDLSGLRTLGRHMIISWALSLKLGTLALSVPMRSLTSTQSCQALPGLWRAGASASLLISLTAAITSELILMFNQAMDCRSLSDDEGHFRTMLVNSLGITTVHRAMWRQRLRIQWLRKATPTHACSTPKLRCGAPKATYIESRLTTYM